MRLRRNGDPLIKTKKIRPTPLGCIKKDGYRYIWADGKNTLEHIVIMENHLGRKLNGKEVVHHKNGIKHDNRIENLLLCKNQEQHVLIHTKEKALAACGNEDYRKCQFCHQYDDVSNLKIMTPSRAHFHHKCRSNYDKKRRSSTIQQEVF